MKNKPYCIIIIFFLLFSSLLECSIELIFEKKIIPQEPFNPFKIKINAHGIFFKPFGQAVVVLIDNDGKTLKKYARKGQGPGELPFITDFCINNNTITCVGNKKLVIFDFEGMLKEEEQLKKKRIRIQKTFTSDGEQYFVNLKAQKKEKNIFRILELITKSGKKIWSILDVSVQKAWSPNYGAKAPFPWFPSPYYNRSIFICDMVITINRFCKGEY